MPAPSQYRFPCERCGASLQFSPGQTALSCPYCGHHQTINPGLARAPGRQADQGQSATAGVSDHALQWDAGHKSPELVEIPLARGLQIDSDFALTEEVRSLSCPNCGALIEVEDHIQATTCPFCATPFVTDTGKARLIKPQGVLPFSISEEQARTALDKWLGSLWFAPSGLVAYARKGRRMAGVYSPFWTFDADTASDYVGRRGDYYYETHYVTRTVDGRTERVAEQVRKTRWSHASGHVRRAFNDVLVLASTSLPRRITDALTPWDLSHLTPYNPQYLAGFQAEGYTIALADGHQTARQEMANVIAMDVRRDIGGDEQQITLLQTQHDHETFKHILLPVWSAAYRYSGKSYRFVVNGQSGRVQGERPYSVWKITFAVIAALIVAAGFYWFSQNS